MPKEVQNEAKYQYYMQILVDPAYNSYKKAEIAEMVGVDQATIWRWNKAIDWEEVKAERRKKYGQITLEVDNALITKAKKGDIRAIEVYFQRFDSWVPTSATLQNRLDDKTDAELIKRAKEIKQELEDGKGSDIPQIGRAEDGTAYTVLPS